MLRKGATLINRTWLLSSLSSFLDRALCEFILKREAKVDRNIRAKPREENYGRHIRGGGHSKEQGIHMFYWTASVNCARSYPTSPRAPLLLPVHCCFRRCWLGLMNVFTCVFVQGREHRQVVLRFLRRLHKKSEGQLRDTNLSCVCVFGIMGCLGGKAFELLGILW